MNENDLINATTNSYGIYQITEKVYEPKHDSRRSSLLKILRFAPFDEIKSLGLTPVRENYKFIYANKFDERVEFLSDKHAVLNRIFEIFNLRIPSGYFGRSLSISDVVILKCNGDISAHYVDNFGFVEVDNFYANWNFQTNKP